MKLAYIFLYLLLSAVCCCGQQLQQIAHPPSTEVYDMLVDKKGFLWLAHNLGISRYDGIGFTSFSNPAQSSLSVTDLIEDNYGRIWCHNFNGQVFYIQNDKMYCLEDYDFRKQSIFPRMVLLGDDLLITSESAGLYVCNTATLKGRYLHTLDEDVPFFGGIAALCLLKDHVLLCGGNDWYTYTQKDGLQKVKDAPHLFKDDGSNRSALQPHAFGDTAFVFNNQEGLLYGLRLSGGRLVTIFKKSVPSAINTISFLDGRVWVNTKAGSFTLDGKDSLNGHNVTAMLRDKQGNEWISSLADGLLVQYKESGWARISIKGLDAGDDIRHVNRTGNWFVINSRQGKTITTGSILTQTDFHFYTFPTAMGTVEKIQAADSDNFFIETSGALYLLNARTHKLFPDLNNVGSVKDIALNNNTAYIALAASVQILNLDAWKLRTRKTTPPLSIADSLLYISFNRVFLKKRKRSRAVFVDTATNSLLIAFSDGLQRLKNNIITSISYNGQPLYVSGMACYKNKIFAATFNNGLFIIEKYKVRKIESNTVSRLDGIVSIKLCNKHLWIFRAHDLDVLDADNEKFVANIYPLPVEPTDVYDVEEDSNHIYLTTQNGVYAASPYKNIEAYREDPTLLYVLANNSDTVLKSNITLSSGENNLLFRLAIPVYKNAAQLHFKYRLVSDNDTTGSIWYYTQDAQRDIQFNALKPGAYTLEINAIKDGRMISDKPLVYQFTIDKPWYNAWWFYAAVLLFTISLSIALYQYRLYQLVKMEHMRRKISNDLHDDIGSTLSSINVYSQLAKTDGVNGGHIDMIQNNTVSIINNLDDLVWNINPKNDTLGQLINRMQLFARPLLQEKGIESIFKMKLDSQAALVRPNVRANIYLLFKEIVNNLIKHSGCTLCTVYFIQKGNSTRLTVKDNGRGFEPKNAGRHRNGLRIMAERVKELKGKIEIKSAPGAGTEIKIDCYLK